VEGKTETCEVCQGRPEEYRRALERIREGKEPVMWYEKDDVPTGSEDEGEKPKKAGEDTEDKIVQKEKETKNFCKMFLDEYSIAACFLGLGKTLSIDKRTIRWTALVVEFLVTMTIQVLLFNPDESDETPFAGSGEIDGGIDYERTPFTTESGGIDDDDAEIEEESLKINWATFPWLTPRDIFAVQIASVVGTSAMFVCIALFQGHNPTTNAGRCKWFRKVAAWLFSAFIILGTTYLILVYGVNFEAMSPESTGRFCAAFMIATIQGLLINEPLGIVLLWFSRTNENCIAFKQNFVERVFSFI